MAEYRLHCFAQSGNAYKAALMLALAGADWEPVFVDYFNGATHTPEFRELNEMGEVPLLEHGDLRLSQSGVILDYLSQRYPDFGPRTEEERREILRWTLWDNHKLTCYIATLRFQVKFLPEEKRRPGGDRLPHPARRAPRCTSSTATSSAASGSPPTDITTADLSCVGYLYYDHEFPHDLATFPNIDRWRQAIAAPARLEAPLRPDARPPDPARCTLMSATGGCQCGRVRYRAAALGRMSLCHCRMCQRATGNAFAPLVTASRRRLRGHARALRLVRTPPSAASAATAARRSSTPPSAATASSS